MRDMFTHVHPVVAIAPAAATTDNTAWVGSWVSRKNAGILAQSVTYLLAIGGVADADATFAVTMDHADASDKSDAAAVSASDLVGTLTLAGFRYDDDNEARKVGYVGNKEWTRITVTPTGNSGAAYLAGIALLGHLARTPPNPPV